jgi:Alpha/beta hydrolase family
VCRVYLAGKTGPIFLCLHGGGYTGLSWALVAERLKESCRVVAPDLRGHGGTVTDCDTDMSVQTLAQVTVQLMWSVCLSPSFCPTACFHPPFFFIRLSIHLSVNFVVHVRADRQTAVHMRMLLFECCCVLLAGCAGAMGGNVWQ